jgi:hypothetical protein
LAGLVAHAWVNARAAADFRALGVPPFDCRWPAGQLWVSAVIAGSVDGIGLRPGDRIVRIAGVPVDGSPRYGHYMLWRVNGRPLRRGQTLSLTIVREWQPQEAIVRLSGITPAQAREVTRIQAMMLPKQVAGFCLWLLGVLVLLRRRDAVTRVFFLWCMALALYTASSAIAAALWDSYPPGLIGLFQTGFTCGWFFAPALFGHFCRVYAGPQPRPGRRRRLLPALFYLMPLTALLATRGLSLGGAIAGTGGRLLWWGLAASWLGTLALGLVMLLRAGYPPQVGGRTTDPLRRKQIQFVFAGSLAYVLVFLHAFITALAGWDVNPTTVWAWLPHVLLLATPLAFAYAILRHRLLDLDVVVRRSLVYTLLTICMGGVFIVLQQLAGTALRANTSATGLPAQTFAAIVVAALFGPTERWIGRLVEAVFNRRKLWRLQQLHRLSQEISFIADAARLEQVLVERVVEVLAVERATLYWLDAASGEYRLVQESGLTGMRRAICFRKCDGLAVWLAIDRVPLEFAALQRDDNYRRLDAGEKERLATLGAALCVPLSAGGQLAGFLTLGPRRDHDLYGAEEKEALLALGGLAAAALRQAEMERRLRELARERARSFSKLLRFTQGRERAKSGRLTRKREASEGREIRTNLPGSQENRG